jgi:outer membrane protein TolC
MSLRTFRTVAIVAAVVLSHISPVRAQTALSDTTVLHLDDLLREVETANPSLQAARLRADALWTERAQVSALPDPTVGVAYQPYSIVTARGPQRSQWQLQQNIPFPGTRRLRSEVAGLRAEVASADAATVAQDLALQVKDTYYTLYRVQEQERLIRRFQEELDGFESSASAQYEVGRGTQQAILKAQIERGRLTVRLEQLAEEGASAQQRLARLLGRADAEGLSGVVRVTPPDDVPLRSRVATALQQRPEASALRRMRQRAHREEALARKAFWPDVTVGLQYVDVQSSNLTPTMTGRDAFAVSLGIRVPLWRGKLRAQVDEAQIEARRAEAQLEALQLDIRTRLNDLQQQRRRQQRQLTLLNDTLIPQAETALEATLNAYSTGRTDFLDLLDAERTLFQLQMEYEATYARSLKTIAAVERTLGVTTLSELNP